MSLGERNMTGFTLSIVDNPLRAFILLTATLGLLASAPAQAASLQKIDQSTWWGTVTGLPGYVNMYIYVPDQLGANPPVVVAPHHSSATASSTYSDMASLTAIAASNGFIMIFPEATGQHWWDAGSTRSLSHAGTGDTGAIVQMVRYALSEYGGDANRVYAVGLSAGAVMTEALLGVYPDVFMAGVSLMGVPCGCWAMSYNDVIGSATTAQWSNPCSSGTVTMTAQQWGDLVRSYFASYTGHRPRLQHWHGANDTILNYKNLPEDAKEWTNVLGLSETPTGSDTPKNGTTRQFWQSSCGYTVYETFSVAGAGHTLAFDGNAVAAYFGLATAGGQDPETAACPGAVPGGHGGSVGSGGTVGTGGASGTGGAGGSVGTGGFAGSGGIVGSDGSVGTGGIVGSGGVVGAGGVLGTGGRGGVVGLGGLAGAGGVLGGGGVPGAGGRADRDAALGGGGVISTGGIPNVVDTYNDSTAGGAPGHDDAGLVVDLNVGTGGVGGGTGGSTERADGTGLRDVSGVDAPFSSIDAPVADSSEKVDFGEGDDGPSTDSPSPDVPIAPIDTAGTEYAGRHELYGLPSCSFGQGSRSHASLLIALALALLSRRRDHLRR
jgi:poly(hydroxyalkanoate) depolymerase family esterase